MPVYEKVPISAIKPGPFQVRTTFDEEAIEELMQSISEIELLAPVILRKNEQSNGYELIAGERRWRACEKAGFQEIDALIHEDLSDFHAQLIAGSENIHREDLTSYERENLIYRLWEMGRKTGKIRDSRGGFTDLANRLGKTPDSIANTIHAKRFRDSTSLSTNVSTGTITYTRGLPREDRTKVLERVTREEIAPSNVQEYVQTIKKVSEPVRRALLALGSRVTPKIALKIERKIHTHEGKKEAVLQIEEQDYHSAEYIVEQIVDETSQYDQEIRHTDLKDFLEGSKEEEGPEKVSFQSYRHTGLDGEESKRILKVGTGLIIKMFSGTPLPKNPTDVVCPHFIELKWSLGCPYACAWCYLQGTLRHQPDKTKPVLKDRDLIAQQLEFFLYHSDAEILNTGELSDSLMDEKQNEPFSHFIIDLVKRHRRDKTHKVLFLTKSPNVQNLLEIDGQDVAIVSFSINAPIVARRWEKKAASVKRRLEAAKQVNDVGYEVRLRIDPMVPIEGWQKAYLELIDLIFDHLTPERITLGSLRGLQSTINNARDASWTEYLAERSNWGLKIPFRSRLVMYRTMIEHLQEKWNFSRIGICKETLAMLGKLGFDYTKPICNCVI